MTRKRSMRILILLSESWNDSLYPNNNESNWFTDFHEVEVFTISGGAGFPQNHCCKHYFTLCDKDMVKSFLPGKRAGKVFHLDSFPDGNNHSISKLENNVYKRREKLHHASIRLIRDLIWRYGRINLSSLKEYIDYVSPDIVFSIRMGSVKMCRLEHVVSKMTNAPLVAYTGDNEYSQDGITGNLFGRIHTIWTRAWLNKMIPQYRLYYSMSYSQMEYYSKKFGVNTKFLVKSGDFTKDRLHKDINNPIRLVYAGKLYWGRDQTLRLIGDVLREIDRDETRFILSIYTTDPISEEKNPFLNDGKTSIVHQAVSVDKLSEILLQSDIALHVEGLEKENALKTKYSFSTKIIDCLSSGCAVLAVCNPEQAGFEYLRKNDIAFTASDRDELKAVLCRIKSSPDSIKDYARKAIIYGIEHHSKEKTQQMLFNDFTEIIHDDFR